jgi:hypothetical protein
MSHDNYKDILLFDALEEHKSNILNIHKTYGEILKTLRLCKPLHNKALGKCSIEIKQEHAQYKKKYNYIKSLENIFINSNTFDINSKKKALLVGINYKNRSNRLFGCINDIILMENYLKEVYGYTSFKRLSDDTTIKPYKKEILDEIIDLLNNSNPGDTIIFNFSGHGTEYGSLLTLDGEYISGDYIFKTITTYLKDDIKLLIILDCCHSSSVIQLKYTWDDKHDLIINKTNNETNKQIVILSSCLSDEKSIETTHGNKRQGILTSSIINCLNKNNRCSWKYLMTELYAFSHEISNLRQHPQISSSMQLDIDSEIFI